MADDDWKEGLALAFGIIIFLFILMQVCPSTGPEACPAGQILDPMCPAACPCHAPVGACACTDDCPAERLKPDWTCCPEGSVWNAAQSCCSVSGICVAVLCNPATRLCTPGVGDCPAGGCCPFGSAWSGTLCSPAPGPTCSTEGASCILSQCCPDLTCTQPDICEAQNPGPDPGDCLPASRLSPTGLCCPVGSEYLNGCCRVGGIEGSCVLSADPDPTCPGGTYWNYAQDPPCCTTSPTCESGSVPPTCAPLGQSCASLVCCPGLGLTCNPGTQTCVSSTPCRNEGQTCGAINCCPGLVCTGGFCIDSGSIPSCRTNGQTCDDDNPCCGGLGLTCTDGTCQTGASFCPPARQCPLVEPLCPAGCCPVTAPAWNATQLCCSDGFSCFVPPACDHTNPNQQTPPINCTGTYAEGNSTTCCPGFDCDLATHSCIATSTSGWYCISYSQVGACPVNSCNEANGGVVGPFPACVCDCLGVTCGLGESKNNNTCSCVALMPTCSIPNATVPSGQIKKLIATFTNRPPLTTVAEIQCNNTHNPGDTVPINATEQASLDCKYFVPVGLTSQVYTATVLASNVQTCTAQINATCKNLTRPCASNSDCCDMCTPPTAPQCNFMYSGTGPFLAGRIRCDLGTNTCKPYCVLAGGSCYSGGQYFNGVCCSGGCRWTGGCGSCQPNFNGACSSGLPCCANMYCSTGGQCKGCIADGQPGLDSQGAEQCCSNYAPNRVAAYGEPCLTTSPFRLGYNHCYSVSCPPNADWEPRKIPPDWYGYGCCPVGSHWVGAPTNECVLDTNNGGYCGPCIGLQCDPGTSLDDDPLCCCSVIQATWGMCRYATVN
ncbi:MAG: hypothetical protein NT157_04985 [Candidatus Micrarchaeota archaeon]|nr:hypothetical protein [Candidatus Micrarchaeota archaeon]